MRKRVYPKKDTIVRDPLTKEILTGSGKEVDINKTYWRRRLKDGDVTLGPSENKEPQISEEVSEDGSN